MAGKPLLVPGPDHPITVAPAESAVTVRLGDRVIASTDDALVLRESTYRPVYYLPLDAVAPDVLRRTRHRTYCPYKGFASYYSLVSESGDGEQVARNAVWSYEEPYDAVADIAGRVAFYPQYVEISVTEHAGPAAELSGDDSG